MHACVSTYVVGVGMVATAAAAMVGMAVTEEVQLLVTEKTCVCMLYIASGIYDN